MFLLSKLKEDPLLSKVLRSSAALLSTNTLSLALNMAQSILAARLLGVATYGLVSIFISYATTVNGLLSFRMSELVVRYGGEYLVKNEKEKTAAIIKAAALSEAAVSLLAFLFVSATAILASRHFAKTPDTAGYFIIYSFALLANFNTETSTGVLQMLGKIKYQGILNLVQSIVTAGMIAFAFFTHGTMQFVLYAYLTGKVIIGLGIFCTAFFQITKKLGSGWWKAKINSIPKFKELARFAFSSNISATVILTFRESDILWVGYFLTPKAAGYYKAAYAIVNLLSVPANPFILTTYPEINKLVMQKAWPRLKDFLKKITSIAAIYNLALAAGFVLFGKWLLFLSGEQYVAAYPVLLVLLVGFTFNYILFWNRPLLLTLGLPQFPIYATLIAGLLKLALAFPLIPRYGIVAAGALLSFYYIASVGIMVFADCGK